MCKIIPSGACSTKLVGCPLNNFRFTTIVKTSQIKSLTCHGTQNSQNIGRLALETSKRRVVRFKMVNYKWELRWNEMHMYLFANLWKSQWINWSFFSSGKIVFRYPAAVANSRLSIISLGRFSTVCIWAFKWNSDDIKH